MKNLFARIISTFGGIGYIPLAPGTMGAIAGTVIYFYFLPTGGILWLVVLILLSLLGVKTSQITEKEFQTKSGNFDSHDPSIIVFDEVAGVLFALFGIPKQFLWVLIALILFRIFDIAKPFPVKKFEKLPHGWGIMVDDIVSGILANIILRIALLFFSK